MLKQRLLRPTSNVVWQVTFLRYIRQWGKKIIFILNKSDVLTTYSEVHSLPLSVDSLFMGIPYLENMHHHNFQTVVYCVIIMLQLYLVVYNVIILEYMYDFNATILLCNSIM